MTENKKLRKIFDKNKGGKIISLSQIIILVLGIVAISYAIGSEVKVVDADPPLPEPEITVPTPTVPSSAPLPMPAKLPLPEPPLKGEIVSLSPINPPTPATPLSWSAIGTGILNVLGNAAIATILAFAVYGLLQAGGVNQEALLPTAIAAGLGYAVGSTIGEIIAGNLGTSLLAFISGPALLGGIIGAATLGGIVFLFTYRISEKENIIFSCNPWQPPAKGEDCRKCGNGILTCTKYQCQSLGAGCKLINEGMTDERCDWVNRDDVNPPLITPWKEILKNSDYKYTPDTAISPPDKGVILQYKNGELPAFKEITFGIHLIKDEASKEEKLGMCRASTTKSTLADPLKAFDAMPIPLSNLEYLENHTIRMSFPGVANAAAEGLNTLKKGENTLYIRCKSANDAINTADFVIKFNIEKGPDTNPPEVFITNPLNNVPIQHGTTTMDATFYINEPSDCKWSKTDQSYDSMGNPMTCQHSILNPTYFRGQITYPCTTTLTGLTDSENKFYIRCKDQPIGVADNLRNVMPKSYIYTLQGTQSLVINSAGPSGIVKGQGSSIKVTLTAETTAGFNAGAATCYYNEKCYNPTGNADNYIQFLYPAGTQLFSQFKHSQDLYLPAGNYDCSIKCLDLGGNPDAKTTRYSVQTDNIAPFVARIYYESPDLKIITNEPSQCVYDKTDCTYVFADGLKMTDSSDGLSHSTAWDARSTFYIKCMDLYTNQPKSNECSAVVRPV